MIIKCPSCNGALEYDVKQGLLYCKFCGSFFKPDEVDMPKGSAPKPETNEPLTSSNTTGQGGWAPQGYVPGNYATPPKPVESAGQNVSPAAAKSLFEPYINPADSNEFNKYNSYQDLSSDATQNRESGKTGDFAYDVPTDVRERNKNAYYEEQKRLHEEYINRPKVDYSKPFAGTSRENMTEEERAYADIRDRQQYLEEQDEINSLYNGTDFFGRKKDLSSKHESAIHAERMANMYPTGIVGAAVKNGYTPDYGLHQGDMDMLMRGAAQNGNMPVQGAPGGMQNGNIPVQGTPGTAPNGNGQIVQGAAAFTTGMQEAKQAAENAANEAANNTVANNTANNTANNAAQGGTQFTVRNAGAPKRRPAGYNQNVGPNGVRYTGNGARILCDRNMYVTTSAPVEDGKFTMDNNIYTCTSCGAELALTGVETSSFCAYCGQPTIVFNRMEKTTMPDFIIPFVVTKEEALKKIREKLSTGIFVPSKLKNFEVERLRGIYIPYWLFDADYTDSMVVRTKVKSGKTTVTKYYRMNTHCELYYFPVDASKNLNDNISRKLEPYDYSGIRPFNPAYMSGFYSDRFDMSADTMMMTSMYRAQYMMYEKAKKKVPGSPCGMTDSYPMYHVKKKYYTMLPAWFMTIRYNGIPYTIMVNGQNGKVVGAVPYDQKKFWAFFGGMFAAAAVVGIPLNIFIMQELLHTHSDGTGKLIAFMVMGIATLYAIAWGRYKMFKKSMELSSEEDITNFVKERQDMD